MIDPAKPDPSFPYWETLSFENADKYQPDLLLFDDRNYPGNLDDARRSSRSRRASRRSRPSALHDVARLLAAHLRRLRRAAEQADRRDREADPRASATDDPSDPSSGPPRRRHGAASAPRAGLVALARSARSSSCFLSITLGSRAITLGDDLGTRSRTSTRARPSQTVDPRDARAPHAARAHGRRRARRSAARSCRASPATRWPTPGSWASTPARPPFIVRRASSCSASQQLERATSGSAFARRRSSRRSLVYGVASLGREGATPVKLALAGAAVTAGLHVADPAIVMTNVDALDELRFWQVGSLAGRYMPVFWQTAPFIVVGLVARAGLRPGAQRPGARRGRGPRRSASASGRTRVAAVRHRSRCSCGAATAACGPIVFVGLVVPHLARLVCGPDYRWILPYSHAAGADRAAARRHRRPGRRRARRAAGRRRARRPRRARSSSRLVRYRGPGGAVSPSMAAPVGPTRAPVRAPPARAPRRRPVRRAVACAVGARRRRALFVLTMMVGSFRARRRSRSLTSVLRPRPTIPASTSSCASCGCRPPLTALAVGLALGVVRAALPAAARATRWPRPTSSASRPAPSLVAVAAIVLFEARRARVSRLRPRRRARQRRAHLPAGLAGRHHRLPLHPHRHRRRRSSCSSLVGYLARPGRDLRRPAGHDTGWSARSARPAPPSSQRARRRRWSSCCPLALLLDRQLRVLELGDDAATALGPGSSARRLGAHRRRRRARRLRDRRRRADHVRGAGGRPDRRRGCSARAAGSLAAALVGADRSCSAPTSSRSTCCPSPLPTGVVTGAVGAPYLVWLLVTDEPARSAADERATTTASRRPHPRLRRRRRRRATSTSPSPTARSP